MSGDIKTGWKTTEFWVTIATWLIFLLVQAGVFQTADQTGVQQAAGQLVSGVAVAISSALYIWSRAKIKRG